MGHAPRYSIRAGGPFAWKHQYNARTAVAPMLLLLAIVRALASRVQGLELAPDTSGLFADYPMLQVVM